MTRPYIVPFMQPCGWNEATSGLSSLKPASTLKPVAFGYHLLSLYPPVIRRCCISTCSTIETTYHTAKVAYSTNSTSARPSGRSWSLNALLSPTHARQTLVINSYRLSFTMPQVAPLLITWGSSSKDWILDYSPIFVLSLLSLQFTLVLKLPNTLEGYYLHHQRKCYLDIGTNCTELISLSCFLYSNKFEIQRQF